MLCGRFAQPMYRIFIWYERFKNEFCRALRCLLHNGALPCTCKCFCGFRCSWQCYCLHIIPLLLCRTAIQNAPWIWRSAHTCFPMDRYGSRHSNNIRRHRKQKKKEFHIFSTLSVLRIKLTTSQVNFQVVSSKEYQLLVHWLKIQSFCFDGDALAGIVFEFSASVIDEADALLDTKDLLVIQLSAVDTVCTGTLNFLTKQHSHDLFWWFSSLYNSFLGNATFFADLKKEECC